MNFFVENWYLIVLALISGAMLIVPALQGGAGGGLSTAEAVQLINHERAVVIDVCGVAEFAAGHVGGAKNVPLGDLESRLTAVVKNKTLPLVMVCARGSRAKSAVAIAQKLGYAKAQVLAGGLKAWKDAGLPIEKTEKA